MLGTIVLVLLILMLLGAIPVWPYSRSWGYHPLGIIGTLLVIYLVFVLLGYVELALFTAAPTSVPQVTTNP